MSRTWPCVTAGQRRGGDRGAGRDRLADDLADDLGHVAERIGVAPVDGLDLGP